jgi:hypothetical protein
VTIRRHAAPTAAPMRGVLISTPDDGGRATQLDTVQCVHCSRVWAWVPGSGRRRGYCARCHGLTCGSDACDHCVPVQQLIDNLEKGLPYDLARTFRPIVGRVEGHVPKG